MTRSIDIDQLLDDWLAEGPSQMPDRVVASITADIRDAAPNRRWRVPWSNHMYRNFLALAGGAAVILVVAALALSFLGNRPNIGATPSPSPTADLGIFGPVAGRIVYYENSSLWGVDPDATSPESSRVPFDPKGPGGAKHFTTFTVPLGWSSDGTKLLFLRQDPTDQTFPYDRHLFILHADGTETQVRPEPVADAAISPDGSLVAFSPDGEGLYVVDAEGGEPVRIAQEGASPTFSAHGTQIAYLALPRSGCCVQTGREHVWVVNVDGTGAHEILANEPALAEGVFELTWSPTGSRVAMENSLEGHVAIYTFEPDGSNFTKLIAGGSNPYWSPDGSRIAYQGQSGLSIADWEGSNVRSLGLGAPGPWHPWSQSPSPWEAPGFSRFTSPFQRISIDYPSDWQVRPASTPWGLDAVGFDSTDIDIIFDPALGGDLYIGLASGLASEPLHGAPHPEWPTIEGASQLCQGGGGAGWITVDGAKSWSGYCGSDPGSIDHYAAVGTVSRGYLVFLHVGDPSASAKYGGDVWETRFETLLDSVDLLE